MKKFIILGLGILCFTACKKETPSPATADVPIGTTTASGNYAVFSSRTSSILMGGALMNGSNVSDAYCSNSILVNDDPFVGTTIDMGDVSMNGVVFERNDFSSHFFYTDSTFSSYTVPHHWTITGTASVPGFSYTNSTSYPIYTGYAAIADSFVISSDVTIPLVGYSGADVVETYFISLSPTNATTSIQKYTNNPTSISFTTTDLAAIGINNNVSLVINFYKNNVQVINGKNYNFRTGYGFTKYNTKFK